MHRFSQFYRNCNGLVGADFALVVALIFAARHVAMCHGTEIAAALRPIFG
jgi:hypothetical protein